MTHEKINKVFEQFAIQLEQRFARRICTTEDSVRYTLFHCLTSYLDITPLDIVVEYPHSQIPKAMIDTYVLSKHELPGLIFEFKFDRKIPSHKNLNKTQRAGNVFSDIFRLVTFKSQHENLHRYFVYVTDKEMATYFRNPYNQLNDFFDLDLEKSISIERNYIENHPDTFIRAVGKPIVTCDVIARLKEDFDQGMWLRIYEVKYKGEKHE